MAEFVDELCHPEDLAVDEISFFDQTNQQKLDSLIKCINEKSEPKKIENIVVSEENIEPIKTIMRTFVEQINENQLIKYNEDGRPIRNQ